MDGWMMMLGPSSYVFFSLHSLVSTLKVFLCIKLDFFLMLLCFSCSLALLFNVEVFWSDKKIRFHKRIFEMFF